MTFHLQQGLEEFWFRQNAKHTLAVFLDQIGSIPHAISLCCELCERVEISVFPILVREPDLLFAEKRLAVKQRNVMDCGDQLCITIQFRLLNA